MRKTRRIPPAAVLAAAVLAAAALMPGAQTALAAAPDEPSVDLANMLQGRFNGVAGPGNKLFVVVQPRNAGANNTFVFDVTVQGKYEEHTISFHGSLRIDRESRAARLTWRNADSRGAQRNCDFPVQRVGDAFEGKTLRDACMSSFQIPTPGTWSIHVEPGTVTLKNGETGETLRFAKSAEK